MRRLLIFTLLLVFICSALAQTTKKTATKKTAPAATPKQDQLSPEFKKQAWKALDALQRIPLTLTEDETDQNVKNQLNDASKAIDEAKYVADTDLDKYVLHALQMAHIMKTRQSHLHFSDELWNAVHRYQQCTVEVSYYVNPSALSEKGAEQGKKRICNAKTDEWEAGITK